MSEDLQIQKDLLVCPGDTIQETIDVLGMSQRELAERLGYPTNKLNQLIKGDVGLSPEMAAKLEHVLGISARTWLELERMYQEEKLALAEKERMENQKAWLDQFPIAAMRKLGILSGGRKGSHHVEELLRFFQVASYKEWKRIYLDEEIAIAFKISLAQASNPYALSVWLKQGEWQAQKLELAEYDATKFKQCLKTAQILAYKQPKDFQEQLQQLCAHCGVALVYTPMLPKAPVNGSTRWLKRRRYPLLQLSDRYKTADFFWFAFFHEAAHILKHGKTEVFLDGVKGVAQNEQKEKEADQFALKMLLRGFPLQTYSRHAKLWSQAEIMKFSDRYEVHPGILVAQLQRVGSLSKKNLNGLKVKIKF